MRAVAIGAALGVVIAAAGCSPRQDDVSAVSVRRAPLTWGPTPDGVDTPVVGVSPRAVVPRGTFNGREMMVTWEDARGIAATRVAEDGRVFDDANFHINQPTGLAFRTPDVATDGQSFFFVWAEVGSPWLVRGARVTVGPDGDLVAGDPITISTADVSALPTSPRVVYGGGNYGVVWYDEGYPKWRVLFARVSAAGALVDSTPVVVADTGMSNASIAGTESAPDILWDGQRFAIGWRELRPNFDTIVSLRWFGTGLSSRLDAVTAVLPVVTGGVALAYDGTRTWIAWEQFAGGTATQASVVVRRVQAGIFTGPAQAVQTTDRMTQRQPALVFEASRSEMALAHADSLSKQITFQRLAVDTAAPLLSPVPIVSTGDTEQVHPLLIRGTTTTLVAWETANTIYGTRLRDTATPLDAPPLLLSRSLNPQYTPMVAGGDAGFGVVWRDQRLGGFRLFGMTLSPDGAPLLPAASPLITEPRGVGADAVGWGGNQFLATGTGTLPNATGGALLGRLFGIDGAPKGSTFTAAPQSQAGNRVAYAAGTFLVVGQGNGTGGRAEVRGARVRSDGTAPGTVVIDASGSAATAMGVASDGVRFLAVWASGGSAIMGRLVNPDGTLVGTAAVTLASSGSGLYEPAAAFGAGVYLVVWRESGFRRIMGTLVSTDGVVLAPGQFPISAPGGGEADAYPGVAFDGARFVAAWKSLQVPDGGEAVAHEIRYAPVTPAGVVGATALGATDDGSERVTEPVALGSGTGGRVVLAYAQADSPGGYPIARARIRVLRTTPAAGGGGCASGADCLSGLCVDGVCCATACAGGPIDCQACSRLAGASVDGMCSTVPNGRACGAHGTCSVGVCQEPDAGTTMDDGGTTTDAGGSDARADGVDGAIDTPPEGIADRAADLPVDRAPDGVTDGPGDVFIDVAADAGARDVAEAGADDGAADVSTADASTPVEPARDAGSERPPTSGGGGGCSCRVGAGDAPAPWFGGALLLLAARWRRRPAP